MANKWAPAGNRMSQPGTETTAGQARIDVSNANGAFTKATPIVTVRIRFSFMVQSRNRF